MMKIQKIPHLIAIFLLVLLVSNCKSNEEKIYERLDINTKETTILDFKFNRYEKDLFALDTTDLIESLNSIREEYPIFLGEEEVDSVGYYNMIDYLRNEIIREAYTSSEYAYQSLFDIENEFDYAFQHLLYYFPAIIPPEIYTYISWYYIEEPVIYTNNTLMIGIDMYLGDMHENYKQLQFPEYKIRRFKSEYIIHDCIDAIGKQLIEPATVSDQILDQMLYQGKRMYFCKAMLPETSDSIICGYKAQQLGYCMEFEGNLWNYFIENNLLFSSDHLVSQKFLEDGPFTQSISQECPARVGAWLGYRIIAHYMMNNPDVELREMLINTNYQEILNKSGYKPK